MSRARRVRDKAITKESVRGTAWPDDPDLEEGAGDDDGVDVGNVERFEVEPGAGLLVPCPRCGGELKPIVGWRRILDPKLVCTECHRLWSDTEAVTGSWYRADGSGEQPLVRRHLLITLAFVFGGGLIVAYLIIQWINLEQFVRRVRANPYLEDWMFGTNFGFQVWTARVVVPVLAVSWLVLGNVLVRRRENSNETALSVLGWFILALPMAFFI